MHCGVHSLWNDNLVLRQLGGSQLKDVFAGAELVNLQARQMLRAPEHTTSFLYFPINCLLSAGLVLDDGGTIEITSIGHEGMLGIRELLTGADSGMRAAVVVPGAAIRIDMGAFRDTMSNRPFAATLQQYMTRTVRHMARAIACSRLHTIEQRCARWLLEASDRLQFHMLPVTHEQVALLLGVARPGLSNCLRRLQLDGL